VQQEQAHGDCLMRLFLSVPVAFILGILVHWILLSHCHQTWEWLYQFCEQKGTAIGVMMNVKDDDVLGNTDVPSAPVLCDQSNRSSTGSIDASDHGSSKPESAENRALMIALGASPCPSLGLGSSSTSGQDDNATSESDSEARRQSDIRNDSVLSSNVTIRKSVGLVNKAEENESDGWSLVEDAATPVPSAKSDNAIEEKSKPTSHEKAQVPEEVMTGLHDFADSLMSPMMSPNVRFSDDFESAVDINYATPMTNDEIAGLSPIVQSRESDITNVRLSPSEHRVGAMEVMVTHPEEANPSASTLVSAYQSSGDKQQASQEEGPSSTQDLSVMNESGRGNAEKESSMAEVDDAKCATEILVTHPETLHSATLLGASQQGNESFQSSQEENSQPLQDDTAHSSHDRDTQTASDSEEADADTEGPMKEEAMSTQPVVEDTFAPMSPYLSSSQRSDKHQNSQEELASSTHDSGFNGAEAESVEKEESEAAAAAAETEEPSNGNFESVVSSPTVSNSVVEDAHDGKEQASVQSPINETSRCSNHEGSLHSHMEEQGGAAEENTDIYDESSEQTISYLLEASEDLEVGTGVSLASSEQVDSPRTDASLDAEGVPKEPTCTYRDLTSAKKNLDASSMAFIERLRGAAHRRKLRVARSRDSLAAKEREHLLSIASANERRLIMAPKEIPIHTGSVSASISAIEPYKPFKARPVPSTTGHFGSGGQVGVPKVEKKPTTTPFSPLLGARRPQKEKVPAVDSRPHNAHRRSSASRLVSMVTKSLTPTKSRGDSMLFKARPAPPTTGIQGHGGQVGVPKVAKRPATKPVSPCLGRRRASLPVAFKERKPEPRPSSPLPNKRELTSVKPFERLLAGSEVRTVLALVYMRF